MDQEKRMQAVSARSRGFAAVSVVKRSRGFAAVSVVNAYMHPNWKFATAVLGLRGRSGFVQSLYSRENSCCWGHNGQARR